MDVRGNVNGGQPVEREIFVADTRGMRECLNKPTLRCRGGIKYLHAPWVPACTKKTGTFCGQAVMHEFFMDDSVNYGHRMVRLAGRNPGVRVLVLPD